MKIPCDVIQDLLPLYFDGVCSEESRRTVEEHLQDCGGCKEELRLIAENTKLISDNMKSNPQPMKESKIAEFAAAAWKKGKVRAFLKGALVVMLLGILSIVGFYGFRFASSANGDNIDALAREAGDYFGYGKLSIEKLVRRGDYMAAICKAENGKQCMCVFRQDSMFENRWRAIGGKTGVHEGGMGSWNCGERGMAILVFVGTEIPKEACWYTFYNGGITYLCPVEDSTVLDLFVILDQFDCSGHPVLLDADYQEVR